MHVHTCPSCNSLFESSASGSRSLCPDCVERAAFDDEQRTPQRIVIPLRELLKPLPDDGD
jgi:hypothetical protein